MAETPVETPAQNPAPQTPQSGGAQQPAAPAPTNFGGRFNRQQLIDQIADPLETQNTKKSYRYPLELGSPEFPHYVAFYPLVREGSQYAQLLGSSGLVFDQSDQNRVDPENGGVSAGAAGALAGAAIGIGKALSQAGGKKSSAGDGAEEIGAIKSLAGTIGRMFSNGGVGGLVGGAFGLGASQLAGEQRAIFGDSEILLHVSERVSATYSANWDTGELGGIVGAIASGQVQFSGSGTELLDYGTRKATKIAGLAGFDELKNVIEATSKKVENPYREQLFRSMGFRKFMFDYRFSPRNKAEAEMVFGNGLSFNDPDRLEGIIPVFLRHMHPTKSKSRLFLSYPSEFLIIYYHNGSENRYVRKISNCALVNMSVDYGAEGYTTFADGVPTEAVVRMEFVELETMTAERIEAGF